VLAKILRGRLDELAAPHMSTNYAFVVHQLGHAHRELTADAWARGGSVYGPYGYGAAAGTAYYPATGAWAHGAAVYGPYGGADA
jgi:hypothetical protein